MLVPKTITSILIDKNNYDTYKDKIILMMKEASVVGIDTETHNNLAHDGIKEFRKKKEGRAFDYQRMVITGLSIYPELNQDLPIAFYFNLNHADVENRLTWEQVKEILDAKPSKTSWIAHNAVYEYVVIKSCYDYWLDNVIDTLQMAVSAWGPDEYDHNDFICSGFGEIATLFPEIETLFASKGGAMTPEELDEFIKQQETNQKFNARQQEYLSKVLGKQSKASFSYNGLIKSMAYGYGLKGLVKKFFDYQMQTYDETLDSAEITDEEGGAPIGAEDMGQLTGAQVATYGSEDAYWAAKLFFFIYKYMTTNCPEAINTFFVQENPMVKVFAETRLEGMRVNKDAVENRRAIERSNFAQCLREMKAIIREMLPFNTEPNAKLASRDKWYADKSAVYRKKMSDWALSDDEEDDFKQVCQVSSPVSNAWAGGKCNGISIGHYFQTRILMYDLCRMDPIISKGKTQSDAESRGVLKDRVKNKLETCTEEEKVFHEKALKLLSKMNELASIEQRMKLYLTPYSLLTDPDTSRMYPELTSMLATRRMACSNPNAQQLAKRGDSTYVRGFFEADNEDELLVSLDWSQVELVLAGEFSGDPEFKKAYGQLPYQDMHLGATASILQVLIPEVTEDMLINLDKMDIKDIPPGLLVKPNGDTLDPAKAKKFWRTTIGKGANFNYLYSGALSTVGEVMGWTSDQMWKATEAYRERFAVAEAWRVGTIEFVRDHGYVQLPDGHKRTRWEATYEWTTVCNQMLAPLVQQGYVGVQKFMQEVFRVTRIRAGNQAVNAMIQGTSATLTKRSILGLNKAIAETGLRARFKVAIHDEVVFSVHRDDVVKFIDLAKFIMTNHPDIVKNLKLYCTASIGETFEPYEPGTPKIGQIELDECPKIPCIPLELYGTVVPKSKITDIINWIFDEKKKRME